LASALAKASGSGAASLHQAFDAFKRQHHTQRDPYVGRVGAGRCLGKVSCD
jgi:hypothetical protein